MAFISNRLKDALISKILFRGGKTKAGLLLLWVAAILIGTQLPIFIQLIDYVWSEGNVCDNESSVFQIIVFATGMILLSMGLFLLFNEFFGYSDRKKLLDTLAINELDNYTSPDDLNYFFYDRLLSNHAFFNNQLGYLEDYYNIMIRDENIFRHKKLRLLQLSMVANLAKLIDFLPNNFGPGGAGQLYKLCPGLPSHNVRYQECFNEMEGYILAFLEDHNKFRETIYKVNPNYSTRNQIQL